ncbi:MAG: hypothetical protein JWN76_2081 [Chitinophagaceae bacterium]|nr:hypothetical protein [Chitinophagaceae bacterium]
MKKLKATNKIFSSMKFFIAIILFSLFAFSGQLTVSGQSPYSLKFYKVRVINTIGKYAGITSEHYDENGGAVEIEENGDFNGYCPGGLERLRFTWSFMPVNISQVSSNRVVSARLDIKQLVAVKPCTNSFINRTEMWLAGSDGAISPFAAEEMPGINSGIFYERGRIMGEGTNIINITTRENAFFDSKNNIAWFEISIGTATGSVRYIYMFDIIRGGQVSYAQIGGAWESSFSGSWKAASIRQEGNRLWFTNEFGDVSEGIFESATRVKATKWNVAATIQGSNIIWDNGTTWRIRTVNAERIPLKLYWFWGGSRGDNFTTATAEGEQAASSSRYAFIRNEGYVFRTPQPGTVPLKLYYNAARGDNFTTATSQGEGAAQAAGYKFIRVEGYVYSTQQPGTVPLKNYWSQARGDNFSVATAIGERDAKNSGYQFTWIEGYVFPAQ